MPTFTAKSHYLRKPEPYSQGLCKDCKAPTPDYRCKKCKAKHDAKNRGNMEGFSDDETYSVLH